MTGTVLWVGCIMLAGAAGAMAARAVRLPAACGALAGGFVVSACAGTMAAQRSDLRDFSLLILAFVCITAGAGIDLTHLMRNGRSIFAGVVVQVVLVTALVALAAIWLGFGTHAALAL